MRALNHVLLLSFFLFACGAVESRDCPAFLPVFDWPAPRTTGAIDRVLLFDACHTARSVRHDIGAGGGSAEYVFDLAAPTVLDLSATSTCQGAILTAGPVATLPQGLSHFGGLFSAGSVPIKVASAAPCSVSLQIFRTVL